MSRSSAQKASARSHSTNVGSRRVKTSSLVSQVATLIEDDCIASSLKPGDSLPAEGQLAAEFGVSRVVVREAMKVVEARGLIIRQQGKRAVIQEPNAQPVEDFVVRSAMMDKRNILELSEVRKALEIHGARLVARRIADDKPACEDALVEAQALIDRMRQCPTDPTQRAKLDVAFHHLLAQLTGNVILAQMLNALDRPLYQSREENHRAAIRAEVRHDQWADGHQAVLDAITSSDTQFAAQVMEEHLDQGLREVESRPEPIP